MNAAAGSPLARQVAPRARLAAQHALPERPPSSPPASGCQRGRPRYARAHTSTTRRATAPARPPRSRARTSGGCGGGGPAADMRLSLSTAISHGRVFRRLGLGPESRIHLLRNLLTGLVRHERIEASWARVDEMRGYAEKVRNEEARWSARGCPTWREAGPPHQPSRGRVTRGPAPCRPAACQAEAGSGGWVTPWTDCHLLTAHRLWETGRHQRTSHAHG